MNMQLETYSSAGMATYVERPRYNAIPVDTTDDHEVTPLLRL